MEKDRQDEAINYIKRSIVLLDNGSSAEAALMAELACAMEPSNFAYNCVAGVAFHRKHDEETSAYYYMRAVHLRSNDKEARLRLGMSLARLGRFSDAVTQFKACAEGGPNSDVAKVFLCDALIDSGHWIEAYRVQQEYMAAFRPNPRPRNSGLLKSYRYFVIDLGFFGKKLLERLRKRSWHAPRNYH